MVRSNELSVISLDKMAVVSRSEIIHRVLSDQRVSYWLSTTFSPPEKLPHLEINPLLVLEKKKLLWRTEIKEIRGGDQREILVILIWSEAFTGRIIGRKFYPWLKEEELRALLEKD
ncbi:MAG: hypothetical protein J7L26_09920 [Candidatus Aminicenantes bacterium]|nr:hypothetical protein [Candidatus Aminicenantes bacterium]